MSVNFRKNFSSKIKLLDCTLRDGGYYNDWDFDRQLVQDYLIAMDALKVDFIEIGFRTLKNDKFKGGFAFSTDSFINSFDIPAYLKDKIGVMINGSEIVDEKNQIDNLKILFQKKRNSPVSLVRIACHHYEFIRCLPAAIWLKKQGYLVGFNLMQITDRTPKEIKTIAKSASHYPIDVLYFADSLGSLDLDNLDKIIKSFKEQWKGDLGIHTHDNMGKAINNCEQAIKRKVNWIDGTVTGMGRGPGNAQIEYLFLTLSKYQNKNSNPLKLLDLINNYFIPLKNVYKWGKNPFYFLAGKYGIHPSYIQEMLQDNRYNNEDILSVIDYFKHEGGKKFNLEKLESARYFYSGEPKGKWCPIKLMKNKTVLILGSGPSIKKYRTEIEKFIINTKPVVLALNTQSQIKNKLINVRAACHPVRLIGNCSEHLGFKEPLIMPYSMLSKNVKKEFLKKNIYDYGIKITDTQFKFNKNYCEMPSNLVFAYALSIANSGKANQIILAGFDGFEFEDPRRKEIDIMLKNYEHTTNALPILSITPTRFKITVKSIFGLEN